jgi:hypothetical protein
MVGVAWVLFPQAVAFERYQDGCNASGCHGTFTGPETTKGSIFPGDDKHGMHRDSGAMNTDCDLCHTQGDNRNPFLGSSNGTANNAGLGCTGCHEPIGLREHHFANGQTWCFQAFCHTQGSTPPTEDTPPPYYGTVDTNVDDPCNSSGIANTGENWTVTDTIGIDNDGDDVYDTADSDCATSSNTPGEVVSLIVSAHNGGSVDLSYTPGCGTADNILVWGNLAQVSTYSYSGQTCALGNSGTLNWTLPAGDLFFLLVGNDGTAEGSYGQSSAGLERPEESVCTFPQDLSSTCVN